MSNDQGDDSARHGGEVDLARRRFRDAVEEATDQVRRHTGLRLGARWVWPLVAAAAGMSAAWAVRRRLRSGHDD